jgi:hypothetical protein
MRIVLAPTVWFVHFCVVYILATVLCEQLVPTTIAATLAALAVYAVAGFGDYRRWHLAAEGEAAFVPFTHFMLCVLSAVGTIWVAYPALALPSCA